MAVTCSYLEVYQEQLTDLLRPGVALGKLVIREDLKSRVFVEGLTEEPACTGIYQVLFGLICIYMLCMRLPHHRSPLFPSTPSPQHPPPYPPHPHTAADAMAMLMRGSANRRIAETRMNKHSSRSHCVFTCKITTRVEEGDDVRIKSARLHLVDLAGSERQKHTNAEGQRLKEATAINKSLSALGLVIKKLSERQTVKQSTNGGTAAQQHVPYRDAQVTRLLQDSLGGNAKTVLIANISPAASCHAETVSTLEFARRAKQVKNKAVVNEDAVGDVGRLQVENARLRRELQWYKAQHVVRGGRVLWGGGGTVLCGGVGLCCVVVWGTVVWVMAGGCLWCAWYMTSEKTHTHHPTHPNRPSQDNVHPCPPCPTQGAVLPPSPCGHHPAQAPAHPSLQYTSPAAATANMRHQPHPPSAHTGIGVMEVHMGMQTRSCARGPPGRGGARREGGGPPHMGPLRAAVHAVNQQTKGIQCLSQMMMVGMIP